MASAAGGAVAGGLMCIPGAQGASLSVGQAVLAGSISSAVGYGVTNAVYGSKPTAEGYVSAAAWGGVLGGVGAHFAPKPGLPGGVIEGPYRPYIERAEGTGPSIYIPRDATGNPIPLAKQKVNGKDIPLPDPAASGYPHTVLGGKFSSETGQLYRQSATFPKGSWPLARGKNVPWSEVHWYDHGKPQYHDSPHQHFFSYDSSKGGWLRSGPKFYKQW